MSKIVWKFQRKYVIIQSAKYTNDIVEECINYLMDRKHRARIMLQERQIDVNIYIIYIFYISFEDRGRCLSEKT